MSHQWQNHPRLYLAGGRKEEDGVRGGAVRGQPPSRSADANRRGGLGFQEETGQPTGKRGRDRTEPRRLARSVARRREPGGGEGHAQDAAGVAQRGRLIGAGGGPPLPPHGGILRWWSGGGRARRGGFGALRLASGKSGTLASRFKATSAKRRSKTPQVQTRGARREARGAAAGTHRASARRVGARRAHVLAPATPRERGASTRKRRARASGSVSLTSTSLSSLGVCQPAAKGSPRASLDLQIRFRYRPRRNRKPQPVSEAIRKLDVERRDAVENTRNRAPLDARATTTRGAPRDRALDLSWVSDDDARKRRATTLDDGRGILPPPPAGLAGIAGADAELPAGAIFAATTSPRSRPSRPRARCTRPSAAAPRTFVNLLGVTACTAGSPPARTGPCTTGVPITRTWR